jgi:predicted GTPase
MAMAQQARKRIVIAGAAGRDFHNFNVVYRDDRAAEVVAFTATQIPGIAGRRYPAGLAGPLYPDGIPIVDESELERLCRQHSVDTLVFAYSDVPHEDVMHVASRALASGADFALLGPARTMLAARRPVIAISALRTGCGKSQIARWLGARLRRRGLRAAVLRHPMPYGDLLQERVQRFAARDDLAAARCTIEEREEYEPHIAAGNLVFAGVDYAAVLEAAEREADVIVWDGGNNDFPFLRPDLHVAVADALRPGQVATHHPGETVARMADVIVINKAEGAPAAIVEGLRAALRRVNPRAAILRAASPVRLDDPARIAGRRVLVVEDGPTITHGGMAHGAGTVAARAAGAAP